MSSAACCSTSPEIIGQTWIRDGENRVTTVPLALECLERYLLLEITIHRTFGHPLA